MAIRKKDRVDTSALDMRALRKLKQGQMVVGPALFPRLGKDEAVLLVDEVDDTTKPGHRRITLGVFWHDVRLQTMVLNLKGGDA